MKYVKLKEICDLQNGYAFKSSDYIAKSNVLNCRMSNIRPNSNFDIEYSPKYLPEEFVERYREYLLNDGDLVIAMTDLANDPKILGVPTIVNTKGYKLLLNQRVGKLIIKNKKLIDERYLKYALSLPQHRNYYKKFAGGGLQINIGKEHILNIEIPMEEYNNQIKIVNILDKSQELIDKRKEQIEALDELVKSQFIEMFGDPIKNTKNFEMKKLKEISTYLKRGVSPKYVENSSIKVINQKCIYWNELKIENCKYYDEAFKNKVENIFLQKNDVLINSTGTGTLGRAMYFNTNDSANYIADSHVTILRVNNEYVSHVFITNLFEFKNIQDTIYKKCVNGSTNQIELSGAKLGEYLIIVPPIELQNQFAEFVKQVDKLKFAMEKSLKELENNFNSLMQKAFKGELFN